LLRVAQLCGMISPGWFVFSLIVLVMAYLSASYHHQQGYHFWRTFVLAIIGFTGIGVIIYKMFL